MRCAFSVMYTRDWRSIAVSYLSRTSSCQNPAPEDRITFHAIALFSDSFKACRKVQRLRMICGRNKPPGDHPIQREPEQIQAFDFTPLFEEGIKVCQSVNSVASSC